MLSRIVRSVKSGNSARRRKQDSLPQPAMMEVLEPRLLLSGTNGHAPSGHHATMNLVSYEAVTHTALKSGNWNDLDVWSDSEIPVSQSNVLVPEGVTLTLGSDQSANAVSTVRVDGKLRFDRTKDSHLNVETLVVTASGRLEMGTVNQPIPRDTNVRVTFADTGELSPETDPLRIGRGLLVMGSISVVGADTTSHIELSEPAVKGSRTITLANANHGWQEGDEIVVPGLDSKKLHDEEFVVESVDGDTITLSGALQFDHVPPIESLSVRVANMTRNITFESANPHDVSRRGHVMMMHTSEVRIENAAFDGLGRTDKRTPFENAAFDHNGDLVAGTGLNQEGRYAVHFHQAGTDGGAILFRGNSVTDSPGWGVVNHSSHANIVDNVVYNATGSAFVAEAGDEIGKFKGNLAIRSTGSGDGLMERTDQQDFGHRGNGFWFQGTGLEVTDNVAMGSANVGFIYFVQGKLTSDGSRTEFLTENLHDESLDNGKETIDPRRVSIPIFRGNTAIGVADGFQSWFHLQPRRGLGEIETVTPGQTIIDKLTVWNARRRAIHLPYTNGMTIRDAVLINNPDNPSREAIGRNENTENIRYENLRIEGWETGIDVPHRGRNEIVGGYFANVTNLRITMGQDFVESGVSIQRDADGNSIQFASLGEGQLKDRSQQNIEFVYERNLNHNNINSLFVPSTITIDSDQYDNKQFFFSQQKRNFVPFKNSGPNVPEAFVGKTNLQLNREFGLAIGGKVAPAKAVLDEQTGALMSDPVEMPVPIQLLSRRYPQGQEYKLEYAVDGEVVTESETTQVTDGWNLLTRRIDGRKRTIAVFGDTSTPRFKLQPITPRTLNPMDRNATIYVVGQILDDSLARRTYKRPTDLSEFKLRTTDDGRDYVLVKFNAYDRSGNGKAISFRIYFDADTPPLHEVYRNDLDGRSIPEMLLDS